MRGTKETIQIGSGKIALLFEISDIFLNPFITRQIFRIWKFKQGMKEARLLTANYSGTSRNPMWFAGHVYLPRIRRQKPYHVFERDALARARRPDDDERLALLDVKGHPVKDGSAAKHFLNCLKTYHCA